MNSNFGELKTGIYESSYTTCLLQMICKVRGANVVGTFDPIVMLLHAILVFEKSYTTWFI